MERCYSLIELKCISSGQVFMAHEEDESDLESDDDGDSDLEEYDEG